MLSRIHFSVILLGVALAVGLAGSQARADDDIQAYRVYSWSSPGTADRDTVATCRSIDKGKKEIGWALPRREVADVSDLDLPDEQKQGTAYRIFVDYCVHVDRNRERPVGAMTFHAAEADDLRNVKRWGSRQYRTTAKPGKRTPKPGREHFNPPNFDR